MMERVSILSGRSGRFVPRPGAAGRWGLLGVVLTLAAPAAGQTDPDLQRTVSETFEEWRYECFGTRPEESQCQIRQRLLVENSNVVAFAFAIAPGPDEQFVFQMVLPLGINLQAPPVLALNDEPGPTLALERCTRSGCFVSGEIDPSLVGMMAEAETVDVVVFDSAGEPIGLPIQLDGLREAVARLEADGRPAISPDGLDALAGVDGPEVPEGAEVLEEMRDP